MKSRRCPTCHVRFTPKSGAQRYCRPVCRPSQSRLAKYTKVLKEREAPRYRQLEDLLKRNGVRYECEYPLGDFIYDLALFGPKILVEFQGTGHAEPAVARRDWKKAHDPQEQGWVVVWVPVDKGGLIPTAWLDRLLRW